MNIICMFLEEYSTTKHTSTQCTNTILVKSLNLTLLTGTQEWSIVKQINPPEPRCAHSCIIYKDEMYLFGGSKGFHKLKDFYKFSFQTLEWKEMKDCKGNKPQQCAYHSVNMYQNKMLLFGGFDGIMMDIQDLFEYDFEKNEWSLIETTGLPRYFQCASHSSVLWNDELYTFGFNGCDVYCLNLKTFKWRLIPIFGNLCPSDRVCHSCVLYGDSMFISGGVFSDESFSDLYEFNLTLSTWRLISSDFPKRNKHSSVIYRDSIYFLGGANRQTNYKTFWSFELEKFPTNISMNKNFYDVLINFLE
jgi:N-acetylneuraminic acid mutarotase